MLVNARCWAVKPINVTPDTIQFDNAKFVTPVTSETADVPQINLSRAGCLADGVSALLATLLAPPLTSNWSKMFGTAQTYAVIWYDWHHQTRHSLVLLKSPPLYIYGALVSLASLLCRHNVFTASDHANSRHRQRSHYQHCLASHGTAQTCTVVLLSSFVYRHVSI